MLALRAMCACLWLAAAAARAHYGAGHDIPVVRHSLLKPLLVAYPPRLVPYGVKIPLQAPAPAPRWAGWAGWPRPAPAPTPPHHLPDHHYHHHHHHEAPPPAAVLPARPVLLPAAPTVHVPLQVPVVRPPHQLIPAAPPLQPVLPAGVALVPVAAGGRPVLLAPPLPRVPAVPPLHVRPGGFVHASLFATHPRYPFPYPPRVPQHVAVEGRPLVAPLPAQGPWLPARAPQVHEVPEPGPQPPPLEQQPPHPAHHYHRVQHHADLESLYRLQQEYEAHQQLSEEYGAPQPQQQQEQQQQQQQQQPSGEYGAPPQLSEQYGAGATVEDLYPHHLQLPHDS